MSKLRVHNQLRYRLKQYLQPMKKVKKNKTNRTKSWITQKTPMKMENIFLPLSKQP